MPYTHTHLDSNPPKVINCFPKGKWRRAALLCTVVHADYGLSPLSFPYWLVESVASLRWNWPLNRIDSQRSMDALSADLELFIALNKSSPWLSWAFYLVNFPLEAYTQDYIQAWHDTLETRGKVVMINVLIGRNNLCVPTLYDPSNLSIGSDQETFTMLRMWYCLMQLRRGFSELILPRRLVRIDQVEVFKPTTRPPNEVDSRRLTGSRFSFPYQVRPRLGSDLRPSNWAVRGVTHVANFEEPSRIHANQRTQTIEMLNKPSAEGLEFVRAWDVGAVSMISLTPLLFSLVFVALWIGVCVGHFGVDVQVATTTAFTAAVFVVTAGALVIALFAFLAVIWGVWTSTWESEPRLRSATKMSARHERVAELEGLLHCT
ncbi:hypothetical protein LTS09_014434 [Friedmanniomyces endolithicus]|nr:hypothetical protein LTS09_014434 [Friedmanniomyces endolithicus]